MDLSSGTKTVKGSVLDLLPLSEWLDSEMPIELDKLPASTFLAERARPRAHPRTQGVQTKRDVGKNPARGTRQAGLAAPEDGRAPLNRCSRLSRGVEFHHFSQDFPRSALDKTPSKIQSLHYKIALNLPK
jgi:hypothetical protein